MSFDPNLRKEILDAPGMAQVKQEILTMTDLFLPSGEEIMLLTRAQSVEGAVAEVLTRGVTIARQSV